MEEVAQADFRTDAERDECGGVLPRAEVARVAFLLVEETAAGKHGGEIRGSASGGVPGQRGFPIAGSKLTPTGARLWKYLFSIPEN